MRAGFTLVEMLVVITIIGILAGLVTAGGHRALAHAKIAAIVIELSQLDAACKATRRSSASIRPTSPTLVAQRTDSSTSGQGVPPVQHAYANYTDFCRST